MSAARATSRTAIADLARRVWFVTLGLRARTGQTWTISGSLDSSSVCVSLPISGMLLVSSQERQIESVDAATPCAQFLLEAATFWCQRRISA